MKNFKRFISTMLVACMAMSMTAGAVGAENKAIDSSKYARTTEGEVVKLNEGVAAYFEKRDEELRAQGYTVGMHEIVTVDIDQQQRNSSVTEIDVAAYNGYKMKLQTVKTPLTKNYVNISTGLDNVTAMMRDGYSFLVGRFTTFMGVNLGGLYNPFEYLGTQSTMLSKMEQNVLTTQFILIEDKDNKYNDAFYPQSSAETKLVVARFNLDGAKNGVVFDTKQRSTQQTFNSSKYTDYTWMRKIAYDNYVSPFELSEATNYIY